MPRISRALIDAMISHARDDMPNEACGQVNGRDHVQILCLLGGQAEMAARAETGTAPD